MQNIDYRLRTKEQVLDYVSSSFKSGKCFSEKKYKNLRVMKKLGSGDNIQGDAYKACTVKKDKCDIDVALKLILPTVGDIETMAMTITNFLLEERLCPNLPMMYSYSKCGDCKFDKGVMWIDKNGGVLPGEWKLLSNEKKRYKKYNGENVLCTTILNEFAKYGDFDNWVKKQAPGDDEIKNLMFQVFCGIYSIWRNYGATHNDLHTGNVLVHSVDTGGVWEYIIDGTPYYCQNMGFLAVLWDLGFFVSPGLVHIQEDYVQTNGFMYSDSNVQGVDARKFVLAAKYSLGKNAFITKVYNWLIKHETVDIGHAIHEFFSAYTKKPNKPIIETYFMDNYTPIKYFEGLDTATITRLKARFGKPGWEAIVTNRQLSVDEIKMFSEYVDMQLLSRVVSDHNVVDAFPDSLDWKALSRWSGIGEDTIEKYYDRVDWTAVSRFVKLSPAFVFRNERFLDWDAVSRFQTHLPASVWIEFKDRVVWKYMTDERITNWCTAQIQAVAEYMPWSALTMNTRTDLSLEALSKWVDWHMVSQHRPMSVDFIEKNADKLDWSAVTANPRIDLVEVATRYPSKVVWKLVTEPSIELMRKFARKLDWSIVSRTIKQKYIAEFEKYIDWKALQTYNTLTHTTLTMYIGKLEFGIISRTQILSDKFMTKYSGNLDWSSLSIVNMSEKNIVKNSEIINWKLPDNARKFASLSTYSAIDAAYHARSRIDWKIISQHVSDSSIDFFDSFYQKLDWKIISRTAVLSPDVINVFRKNIDSSVYKQFGKFTTSDYTRLGDWVNWDNVSKHARLSAYEIRMFAHVLDLRKVQYKEFDWEFFRVHQDKIDWTSVAKLDLPELFRREFYDKLK